MKQNLLPSKYEKEKETQGLTGLAGLPVYLELSCKMGFGNLPDQHLGVRAKTHGWKGSKVIFSPILLNLAGGD